MKADKLEYALKHSRFLQFFYRIFCSLFFKFVGIFVRQDRNLILFSSFRGERFNDSPKLIYEEISKSYPNEFKCVWAFKHPDNFKQENLNVVNINSFKYFFTALKAHYWVTNVNIERGLSFKKKKTIYLNTWHGICLDHIGNDRPGRKDYNFKKVNIVCVSSPFDEKIYKTAFKAIDSQYLRVGMPRNELFLNSQVNGNNLRIELGLPLNKKIILYAPTWRENLVNKTTNEFKIPFNIEKWKKALSKDYIFLFRAHSTTTQVDNLSHDSFMFDVSDYANTNLLLSIVDILISDYSSILIDYSLLERPIFNFGFDYDDYKKSHGFYVDYEREMPNGIIKDEDALINKVVNINIDNEKNKTKILKSKYTSYAKPNSTKLCVKALLNR